MSKNLIGQSFTGDLVGGIAGNIQIIDKVEFVDDETKTAIAVKEVKRDATMEELAAILGPALAELTAANATLTAQNNVQFARIAAQEIALRNASNALERVAQADAAWDENPRSSVAASLEEIAGLNIKQS